MRLLDDEQLHLCFTVSDGIPRDALLNILGRVSVLPIPQSFDDFAWESPQLGQGGLLNVLEEGELLVTLENSGFLGISQPTISNVAAVTAEEAGHYVAIYRSDLGRRYVEIQDGLVIADFDPMLDSAPEAVDEFFPERTDSMEAMVRALEYRMEMVVQGMWLDQPTDTYIIDYRTSRV